MDPLQIVIGLCCILVALLIHEYAHAWMAYRLGDPTAKYEGRLTLNPLVHFDLFGSVALAISYITSGGMMIMGWAKPVPINSDNFKNRDLDIALVAVAGPMVNFIAAFACSLFVLTGLVVNTPAYPIFRTLIVANVGFGLFNLIPFPPLDGWKILGSILPGELAEKLRRLEAKAGLWAFGGLFLLLGLLGPSVLAPLNRMVLSIFLGGSL